MRRTQAGGDARAVYAVMWIPMRTTDTWGQELSEQPILFFTEWNRPMSSAPKSAGMIAGTDAPESTHCEALPFPESLLSGWDARSAYGRSAQPSCLVGETLTARERDILAMISRGLSNKRIARDLNISPETVKSNVKRIFLRLAVGTRAEAAFRAVSLGLL
jgi:DNA-binding CsgD family transcriptional regulator